MTKKITGLFAALMIMAFAAVSFANPAWHGGPGHGPVKRGAPREMTAEQKAERIQFMEEMNKLRADYLRSEVKAGRMTKEVADAHIVLMNDRMEKIKADKAPEFTEEAKKARIAYLDKVRDLRIKQIKQSISSGNIEKERGEQMIERIEKSKGQLGPEMRPDGRGPQKGEFTRRQPK